MIEPGPIVLSPEPGPTLLSLLRASVPPLLYHYTSVTGFEGIVTSKSIWASAAQFLNDTKEYKLAMDIARRHIAALQEREVLNRDRAKLLGYLHDQCERMEDLEVCIFSLSVEGDLLSQWRGYCPPNGGYSIGFVGADLREVMTAQGGILAPCVYEIDLQERLVAEALAPVLGRLPAAMPDDEAEIELLSDRFATDLFAQLILVAPLIKHHSFVEEGEWRLIWDSRTIAQGGCEIPRRPRDLCALCRACARRPGCACTHRGSHRWSHAASAGGSTRVNRLSRRVCAAGG
jgi:hypothetical protein